MICGKEGIKYIGNHLQWNHKDFTLKKYYDAYLKKEGEGVCLNCGNETQFNGYRLSGIHGGYHKTCDKHCAAKYNEKTDVNYRKRRSDLAVKRHIENPEGFLGEGSWYKQGWYWSEKNNCEIYYQSSYELIAYELLEKLSPVKYFNRCKFSVDYVKPSDGNIHPYIPDLEVVYFDGSRQIIEIKAEWQLEDEIVKAKQTAAKEKFGDEYVIWTQKDLGSMN
jgi:hypothetical protein